MFASSPGCTDAFAGRLTGARAHVADVDNLSLGALAADPRVARVMVDRPAFTTMFRTGAGEPEPPSHDRHSASPARASAWPSSTRASPTGTMTSTSVLTAPARSSTSETSLAPPTIRSLPWRQTTYGHGTHVAGIIAGSGYDSAGARAGMAPGAHLIGLKVLDADGQGYISDVIAAFDYAITIRDAYNIRVINLSVASGVFETYYRDPLTLAAKRAYDAGIVVVAAAGNLGLNDDGQGAVRRHHRTGERALGPDRGRRKPPGHRKEKR
jgi:serine protease AprX